jgi:hypothetical protein
LAQTETWFFDLDMQPTYGALSGGGETLLVAPGIPYNGYMKKLSGGPTTSTSISPP